MVLKNGRITAQGTLEQIAQQDPEVYQNCQQQISAAYEYTTITSGFSGSETETEISKQDRLLLQKEVKNLQRKRGGDGRESKNGTFKSRNSQHLNTYLKPLVVKGTVNRMLNFQQPTK